MKYVGTVLFSAMVGVSCGKTQNNNSQGARVTVAPGEEAQFGYLRNDDELLGVPFKTLNGLAVIGGHTLLPRDMLLTSLGQDELGLSSQPQTSLWPGGRVPYELPPNMEYKQEWAMMQQEWARAGIRWEPRKPSDKEFVRVKMGLPEGIQACGVSFLGKIPQKAYNKKDGPGQPLWLASIAQVQEFQKQGSACNMQLTINHEAGHALGFMHEHQRSDRDQYVSFASNAKANDPNFGKVEGSKNFGPYDLLSIMHYPTAATGALNMRTKNGDIIPESASTLTEGDVAGARAAYAKELKAPKATATTPPGPRPKVSPTPVKTPPPNSTTPPPNSTPPPSSTPRSGSEAQEKRCLVVRGNQEQLFSGELSRPMCEKRCESFAENEHRRCSWGGLVFRAHPEDRCVVRTEDGKKFEMKSVTLSICKNQCEFVDIGSALKSCTWGSRNLK